MGRSRKRQRSLSAVSLSNECLDVSAIKFGGRMSKYLVTGGAGFIGSALVRRLLEQKHEVRVVDNFTTGTRRNLAGLEGAFELVEGDLYDPNIARRCVEGVDFVLHQGAIPSVTRSIENPIGSHRANVDATLNLLDAARGTKVKRFVFASSSSVYGEAEELPKIETMPERPVSPYALNKLAAEKYCILFHRFYGLPTVCLRYFNVFGPRQDPNSPYSGVISCFVAAALKGERPRVYGDGEQSRDFTYVDNVVEANLSACRARGVEGKVFNLGGGGTSHVKRATGGGGANRRALPRTCLSLSARRRRSAFSGQHRAGSPAFGLRAARRLGRRTFNDRRMVPPGRPSKDG